VLLGRIVRNFILNAFKYTLPGGSVEIVCRERGDTLLIEVTDTGVGIPKDKQSLIFEDFRQLDNAERDPSKGHGLGLSIVSRTARLLGHALSLRSAIGAGSTFGVAVPTAEPGGEADTGAAAPSAPPRSLRILLVKDNDLVADVMAETLSDTGSDVTVANSAEAAFEIVEAAQHPFDAVISDFRLPGRSGVDAVAAVRRRWPSAQAVILTGDTSHSELRALPAQGIKLLLKPASAIELAELLAE
jgi:CheY-like chemotaxis protein